MSRLQSAGWAGSLLVLIACSAVHAQDVAAAGPATRVLPAETEIHLRLLKPIASNTHKHGDRFKLEVAEAVVVDGSVVIPAGATCVGEVVPGEPDRRQGRRADSRQPLRARRRAGREAAVLFRGQRHPAHQSGDGSELVLVGLFVQGKNIVLPQGTEVFAKVPPTPSFPFSLPFRRSHLFRPSHRRRSTTMKILSTDTRAWLLACTLALTLAGCASTETSKPAEPAKSAPAKSAAAKPATPAPAATTAAPGIAAPSGDSANVVFFREQVRRRGGELQGSRGRAGARQAVERHVLCRAGAARRARVHSAFGSEGCPEPGSRARPDVLRAGVCLDGRHGRTAESGAVGCGDLRCDQGKAEGLGSVRPKRSSAATGSVCGERRLSAAATHHAAAVDDDRLAGHEGAARARRGTRRRRRSRPARRCACSG